MLRQRLRRTSGTSPEGAAGGLARRLRRPWRGRGSAGEPTSTSSAVDAVEPEAEVPPVGVADGSLVAPDGDDADDYVPLADSAPLLADTLRRRFAQHWLRESGLPASGLDEAAAAVDLRVAPDDEPGERRLRVRMGTDAPPRWLRAWRGDLEAAVRFLDEAAIGEGAIVRAERRRNGSTP